MTADHDVVIAIRSFVFVLLILSHGCKAALSPLLIGRLGLYACDFDAGSDPFKFRAVPGILGSQLEAKLDKELEVSPYWWCSTHSNWYTVWVSLQQLAPYVIDCWINNTRWE